MQPSENHATFHIFCFCQSLLAKTMNTLFFGPSTYIFLSLSLYIYLKWFGGLLALCFVCVRLVGKTFTCALTWAPGYHGFAFGRIQSTATPTFVGSCFLLNYRLGWASRFSFDVVFEILLCVVYWSWSLERVSEHLPADDRSCSYIFGGR